MKVNMTPNPLDVVTIHASQGDTEARQWEFELHNNGELIDTSDVKEQMFFKAYKGGIEQLLPENTSTPTTSPFKGDIKYPQGLLSDQEFLYRESPTEEDGLAKITDIKGNTLNWNQLVQNGNFADSSNWYARQSTFTVSNNVLTATPSTEGTERGVYSTAIPVKANHKYLLSCEINPPILSTARVSFGGSINYGFDVVIQANQWSKCQGIVLNDVDRNIAFYTLIRNSLTPSQTIQYRNMMVVDLTAMGLDITEPSEFTSLFPLSYYSYNQGSLLSFNGNGIKTVGKNLFDENSVLLSQGFVKQNDGSYYKDNLASLSNAIVWKNDAHINGALNIKFDYKNINTAGSQGLRIIVLYTDGTRRTVYSPVSLEFTLLQHQTESSRMVDKILWDYGSSGNGTYIKDFIISVDNISYESYTSSTLSLPISTYFPTGMKRVEAYDELTPTKATTRISVGDLGTLNWSMNVTSLFSAQLVGLTTAQKEKVKSALYQLGVTNFSWSLVDSYADKSISTSTNNYIYIKDTSYTDASAFKTAMNGIPLYFELATPTETPFTTASLVTENAEIPLSSEDGTLIGKCTEQLSENPGFIDAKIKLSDSDGTCYSNKLQLHVERKP